MKTAIRLIAFFIIYWIIGLALVSLVSGKWFWLTKGSDDINKFPYVFLVPVFTLVATTLLTGLHKR